MKEEISVYEDEICGHKGVMYINDVGCFGDIDFKLLTIDDVKKMTLLT